MISELSPFVKLLDSFVEGIVDRRDTQHEGDSCSASKSAFGGLSNVKGGEAYDSKNICPPASLGNLLKSFKVFMCAAEELVSLRWSTEPTLLESFLKDSASVFGLASLLVDRVQAEELFGLPHEAVRPGEGCTHSKHSCDSRDGHLNVSRFFAHLSDAFQATSSGNTTIILDAASSTKTLHSSYHNWENALRLRVQHIVEASQGLQKDLLLCHNFSEGWSAARSEWERRVSETLCQFKLHVMHTFIGRLQIVLRGDKSCSKSSLHCLALHLHSPLLFMVSPPSVTDMQIARSKYSLFYFQDYSDRATNSSGIFVERLKNCLKEELLPFVFSSRDEQVALRAWQLRQQGSDSFAGLSGALDDLADATNHALQRLRGAWEEAQANLHQRLADSTRKTGCDAVSFACKHMKYEWENDLDDNMALYQIQYAFPLLTGASTGDPNSFFLCAAPVPLDLVGFQCQLLAKTHARREEKRHKHLRAYGGTASGLSKETQPVAADGRAINSTKDLQEVTMQTARWENLCYSVGDSQMAEELRKTFFQNRSAALNIRAPAAERMLFSINFKQDVMSLSSPKRSYFDASLSQDTTSALPSASLASSELLPLSPENICASSTVTQNATLVNMHDTPSHLASGASPLCIELVESNAKTDEPASMRTTCASVPSDLHTEEKSSHKDAAEVSPTLPTKEITLSTPIVISRPPKGFSSLPQESASSTGVATASEPQWRICLELCPSLSEEVLPGIYMQDLQEEIQQQPRISSMINQLITKRSNSTSYGKPALLTSHSGGERPENVLISMLNSIACDLREGTLSVQASMPFLPCRINGILLCNLMPQLDKDASFQSLCSIRRQIIRGAAAAGGGYAQRLDRVEQCLRDAASLVARISGIPGVSAEKAEASIAVFSKIPRATFEMSASNWNSTESVSDIIFTPVTVERSFEQCSKMSGYKTVFNTAHVVPSFLVAGDAKEKCHSASKSSVDNNTAGTPPSKGRFSSPEHGVPTSLSQPLLSRQPLKAPRAPKNSVSLPSMGQQAPLQGGGEPPRKASGGHPKPHTQAIPLQASQLSIPGFASFQSGSPENYPVNLNSASHCGNCALPPRVPREANRSDVTARLKIRGGGPNRSPDHEGSASMAAEGQDSSMDALSSPSTASKASTLRSRLATRTTARPSFTGSSLRSLGSGAPDAKVSLREVYQQACLAHSMRPNTGLLHLFPAEPFKRLGSLDLSANYVGAKGIIPLLQVIKHNGDALRTLCLSHNNLENMEVLELVDVLLRTSAGSALKLLDLSYNPISRPSGQALLELCIKRPNITVVRLEGTTIPRQLLRTILETVEKSDIQTA